MSTDLLMCLDIVGGGRALRADRHNQLLVPHPVPQFPQSKSIYFLLLFRLVALWLLR